MARAGGLAGAEGRRSSLAEGRPLGAAGADDSEGGSDDGDSDDGDGHYAAADAAIEQLENQVLLVTRDRHALRRQLDSAMAEVSAAEERRNTTMVKYLDLLNATDAAPKREQGFKQREFELTRLEEGMQQRSDALDARLVAVKKKEIAAQSKLSSIQHGRAGGKLSRNGSEAGSPRVRESLFMISDNQSMESGGIGNTGQYAHVPERVPHQKLAPIMHRPPVVAASTVEHPQRAPNIHVAPECE